MIIKMVIKKPNKNTWQITLQEYIVAPKHSGLPSQIGLTLLYRTLV